MCRLFSVVSLLLYSDIPASVLRIASALTTLEYTPDLMASKDYYKGKTSFVNGGVAHIASHASVDVAADAETQALRQYVPHKSLRIIYTNVIIFQDKSLYSEICHLRNTLQKLTERSIRKSIVAFLNALNQAKDVFSTKAESIWPRGSAAVVVSVHTLKAVRPARGVNGF